MNRERWKILKVTTTSYNKSVRTNLRKAKTPNNYKILATNSCRT